MRRKDVDRGLKLALERRVQPTPGLSPALVPDVVRVSSLGSCGRKTTLSVRHPDRIVPPDAEGSYAMLQGDWAETGMVALLAESGINITDPQKELSYFKDGVEVLRGHIDGIAEFDTGLGVERSLWENKAMSAFRFKKLTKSQSVRETSPEYMVQVQTYMWLLRHTAGEGDIQECLFTAEAKDPSAANMGNKGPRLNPIYVEVIPFNQEEADGYIERAEELWSTINDGKDWEHERTPGKNWDCSEKFCPVYELCDPKNTIPPRKHAR